MVIAGKYMIPIKGISRDFWVLRDIVGFEMFNDFLSAVASFLGRFWNALPSFHPATSLYGLAYDVFLVLAYGLAAYAVFVSIGALWRILQGKGNNAAGDAALRFGFVFRCVLLLAACLGGFGFLAFCVIGIDYGFVHSMMMEPAPSLLGLVFKVIFWGIAVAIGGAAVIFLAAIASDTGELDDMDKFQLHWAEARRGYIEKINHKTGTGLIQDASGQNWHFKTSMPRCEGTFVRFFPDMEALAQGRHEVAEFVKDSTTELYFTKATAGPANTVPCLHCGRYMVPRLLLHPGGIPEQVCPFCLETYQEPVLTAL